MAVSRHWRYGVSTREKGSREKLLDANLNASAQPERGGRIYGGKGLHAENGAGRFKEKEELNPR